VRQLSEKRQTNLLPLFCFFSRIGAVYVAPSHPFLSFFLLFCFGYLLFVVRVLGDGFAHIASINLMSRFLNMSVGVSWQGQLFVNSNVCECNQKIMSEKEAKCAYLLMQSLK
jgi:hypothetical protein